MQARAFDRLAKEKFGEVLADFGFSTNGSRHCSFHRWRGDIVHLVVPDPGRDGTWFDIRVFAHSPLIDPGFERRFPDHLGIPSGSLSFLHPVSGVGPDQQRYRCNKPEGFLRNFEDLVRPALLNHAIPFQDRIVSLEALLPTVVDPFYRAVCLWQLGQQDEARPLLEAELARLQGLASEAVVVAENIDHLKRLLGLV